jgi:hypothetical protein
MNGRVYDYNLGRFLSVDPFIQEPGNSQSMNPYSYIMNNPLAGTDPSGYVSVGFGMMDSFWNQSMNNMSMMSNMALDNGYSKAQKEPNKKQKKPEKIEPGCHDGNPNCVISKRKRIKSPKKNYHTAEIKSFRLPIDYGIKVIDVMKFMRGSPVTILIPALASTTMAIDADCSSGCVSVWNEEGSDEGGSTGGTDEVGSLTGVTGNPDPDDGDDEKDAKDAKRLSKSEAEKAARKSGYKDVHDLKKEFKLDSKHDLFRDKKGNLYHGPRKGTGTPQKLGIKG